MRKGNQAVEDARRDARTVPRVVIKQSEGPELEAGE